MFYPKLAFPTHKGRPFFYTNFVQTVDGKVQVKKKGYWPIGSKKDYQVLLELRAYADCLIHGGNLAKEFGKITLGNLNKTEFKDLRRNLKKTELLPYYAVSNHPNAISDGITKFSGDLKELSKLLYQKGYKNILVEGGPTLLGSFLKINLIDEIFLTIAPSIYGTENLTTLNLVEGYLFPPIDIKRLKLISVRKFGSELFLRYKVID